MPLKASQIYGSPSQAPTSRMIPPRHEVAAGASQLACSLQTASERGARERFRAGSVISPSVVIGEPETLPQSGLRSHCTVITGDCSADCSCVHHHDDGSGWYKGRAGTSAYWAPQMLDRNNLGERFAYGAETDWYSFGCMRTKGCQL